MATPHSHLPAWLAKYNPAEITIGVVASHSSLQILHGARQEGFRTLGICVGEGRKKLYKAFPGAEPDEWLMLDNYLELLDKAEELRKRNVIIIPKDRTRKIRLRHLSQKNRCNLTIKKKI